MTLMCAWQTSGMPIFSLQHPRSTTSSVDQSLEWKMLARWQSCIEQFMVGRPAEETSGTTIDHASNSSTSSCPADPDVWMRPAIKSDGTKCYDYVLLYVNDALVVSENAESILRNELGRYFELKEESIGPPDHYLGGKVRKVQLENGVYAWAFSSSQYVQAAVKNVEAYLDSQDNKCWKMPSKADTPLTTTYRPELDVPRELNEADAAYYQSLIGILRWMVELGRVDLCLEVSMMSSHLALPREGHLEQVLHIFAYLKKYHNTELVYDMIQVTLLWMKMISSEGDWASSEFGHVEGKEEFSANMPDPRGHGFIMRAKVDADHASDTVSRCSRTGLLIFELCLGLLVEQEADFS